jgi:predicted small metal-binding protein
MDKPIRCHCGFEIHAEREEKLVASIRRHARRAHAMTLTVEQALVIALRAELELQAAGGTAHQGATTERRP